MPDEKSNPKYYLTPEDFTVLVEGVAQDFFSSGSYGLRPDEPAHPEDISAPYLLLVEVVASTLCQLHKREDL